MEFVSYQRESAFDPSPVTLLSYCPESRNPILSDAPAVKKPENFLKTLRRRSKSASRLREQRRQQQRRRQEDNRITYTINGERVRNPDRDTKPDKVTLVGFSVRNEDDDDEEEDEENYAYHRFSTLKTSREVKMERDRLRQERLSKLTRETKDWFDKLKSETASSASSSDIPSSFLNRSIFDLDRDKFFEDARERFYSSTANVTIINNDTFNAFMQDHQERFATLMSQHRAVASTFFNNKTKAAFYEGEKRASDDENDDALNNSSEKQSRVRIIPIEVTNLNNNKGDDKSDNKTNNALQRSSSSSSSSGFSSIGGEKNRKNDDNNNNNKNNPLSKKSSNDNLFHHHHHPSFENHFGFSRFGNGFGPDFGNSFLRTNNCERVEDNVKTMPNRSESSVRSSKINPQSSNFNRFESEEAATITSFDDSEAESDDDDEDEDEDDDDDLEHLESASMVDESRRRVKRNGSDGRINKRPVKTTNTKASSRPISAVPSEYSDVSTSSSRTSEGEDEVVVVLRGNNTTNEAEEGKDDGGSFEAKPERAHRIALELLSTEEQYVKVLYLIDQVFHTRVEQENRTQNMFPQDILPQMFANIKSIYKFHAEFLLPQLRERMNDWSGNNQRIGDIFVKFSPFFKMYTEYVKNFGNAIHLINNLYNKNSKFAGIMDEIHAMPECGHLSLQHHMLTPIQRIPRYELLIKDYLKKLPEDSDDREDSEKALHLVSTAASHANDAMKRIEKFKKLLEVQESLSGAVDLVSPTRELVKEGKIVKISARSGDHQERYLFLFSDLLLLCSPRMMTNRVILAPGTAPYRLRARFEVDNIKVLEGDNLVTANSFYIRDRHKSVELYTQTLEEKEDWLEALFQTVKELYERKSSLRVGRETLKPLDSEIGRKRPHLLKLDTISKCMDCYQPFSMMRKKHNCRACGVVVCAKCCGQKFPLTFEDNKQCRVCRTCFHLLTSSEVVSSTDSSSSTFSGTNSTLNTSSSSVASKDDAKSKGSLLDPSSSAHSIISGYLLIRASTGKLNSGKAQFKRFFSLKSDSILYSYQSETKRPLTATPVIRGCFSIFFGPSELKGDSNVSDKDKDRVIKLVSDGGGGRSNSNLYKKVYYLTVESVDEAGRWAEALRMVSKGEFTTDNSSPYR